MSAFGPAIAITLGHEGSTFVADDPGQGPGKFGILLRTYQSINPQATVDDIRNLTQEQATSFYESQFWEKYGFGLISDQTLSSKCFDLCVNTGPIVIRWLQKAVGATVDGILGPRTAEAVNGLPAAQVMASLRAEAKQYYEALAAQNPALYGPDLPGWLSRLDS